MRVTVFVRALALAMLSLGGAAGEFVTFAECDSSVILFDADVWDVPVLKATLSMTPIDTYADHYNYVAAGTGSMVNLTSGQSRLEVTLAVEKESGASGAFSRAHSTPRGARSTRVALTSYTIPEQTAATTSCWSSTTSPVECLRLQMPMSRVITS